MPQKQVIHVITTTVSGSWDIQQIEGAIEKVWVDNETMASYRQLKMKEQEVAKELASRTHYAEYLTSTSSTHDETDLSDDADD